MRREHSQPPCSMSHDHQTFILAGELAVAVLVRTATNHYPSAFTLQTPAGWLSVKGVHGGCVPAAKQAPSWGD